MDVFLPNNLPWLIAYILVAVVIGYVIGSRVARKQKRDLQRELNKQSLDMLEVKSDHTKLAKFLGQSNRKDRLLKLTLKQLTEANKRADMLQGRLDHIEKQHYIKLSRLRLLAAQSSEKARRATTIAARATAHLKRVEKALPATQTINAPPPKSYGQAAAVQVKVVDQQRPESQQDSVMRVSNRDSARFTRLRSSNEEQCFNSDNLQAIDGIDTIVEQKLNKAGIHRVEQLANMSDTDLAALSIVVGNPNNDQNQENYTAAWKGGARRLLNQS